MWDVFRQYGWKPQSVRNVKGIWQIEVDDQKYALKQSRQSREKLLLLHRMLESVREAGYPHLLPWIRSKNGEPVVSTGNVHWYATPWVEGSEEKTWAAEDIVRSLAIFHRLAGPSVQGYPSLPVRVKMETPVAWKEKREKWFRLREQTENQEYPTPFNKVWLNHMEDCDRLFSFAIRGMEKFLRSESGQSPRYTLCHERIHPHNLVWDDQQFYWVDFDHAQVNSPVKDLAIFLQRFDYDQAENLLAIYEEEHPLLPKEKRLLAVYLAYPERLIRLLSHYYKSRSKGINEQLVVQQLERELHRLDGLVELCHTLWPQKKKKGRKA